MIDQDGRDIPEVAEEHPDEELLTEKARAGWVDYLDKWEVQVYRPLFQNRGIGRDAALTCWFVNRLRNALPDDDAGNDVREPWQGG